MELNSRDASCAWSWLLQGRARPKAGIALGVCSGGLSSKCPERLWFSSCILLALLWCKRLIYCWCCEVVIWINLFHIEHIKRALSCVFLTSSEKPLWCGCQGCVSRHRVVCNRVQWDEWGDPCQLPTSTEFPLQASLLVWGWNAGSATRVCRGGWPFLEVSLMI